MEISIVDYGFEIVYEKYNVFCFICSSFIDFASI